MTSRTNHRGSFEITSKFTLRKGFNEAYITIFQLPYDILTFKGEFLKLCEWFLIMNFMLFGSQLFYPILKQNIKFSENVILLITFNMEILSIVKLHFFRIIRTKLLEVCVLFYDDWLLIKLYTSVLRISTTMNN